MFCLNFFLLNSYCESLHDCQFQKKKIIFKNKTQTFTVLACLSWPGYFELIFTTSFELKISRQTDVTSNWNLLNSFYRALSFMSKIHNEFTMLCECYIPVVLYMYLRASATSYNTHLNSERTTKIKEQRSPILFL